MTNNRLLLVLGATACLFLAQTAMAGTDLVQFVDAGGYVSFGGGAGTFVLNDNGTGVFTASLLWTGISAPTPDNSVVSTVLFGASYNGTDAGLQQLVSDVNLNGGLTTVNLNIGSKLSDLLTCTAGGFVQGNQNAPCYSGFNGSLTVNTQTNTGAPTPEPALGGVLLTGLLGLGAFARRYFTA